MSWVRIDDGYGDHPKLVAAGPVAQLVQTRALCYAARHKTDGRIPAAAVTGLCWGLDTLLGQPMANVMANAIAALLRTGLWEEWQNGFAIHDYLQYNPSKRMANHLARTRSRAGSLGAKARWNKAEHHGNGDGKLPCPMPCTDMANPDGKTMPPSPSPSPNTSSSLPPPSRKRMANSKVPHGKVPPPTVEGLVAEFRTSPAYAGLDVRAAVLRCAEWCRVRAKTLTRQRVVNWLNRDASDVVAPAPPGAPPAPLGLINLGR